MKVAGIVAEYNPFHFGHKYHIEKTKEMVSADAVIAVMSGNFVQRGEPALLDKNARARAAIKCGVDLVLELPVFYAISSAEIFAKGSIGILDATGIVDYLSFGSENGNIDELKKISDFLYMETRTYKKMLKEELAAGSSYPAAMSNALKKAMPEDDFDVGILRKSNNILAIEYLKSLKRINSVIEPVTVKRFGQDYKEGIADIKEGFASATAIRNLVYGITDHNLNAFHSLKKFMPEDSYKIFLNEIKAGRVPVRIRDLENIFLWRIRSSPTHELREIYGMNEGLENRIKKNAQYCTDMGSLISSVLSKRYTEGTINRLFLNIILNITKQDAEMVKEAQEPGYIKVLDFSETGKKLLSKMRKSAKIPIITKPSDIKKMDSVPTIEILKAINEKAYDLYSLGYPNKMLRIGGNEYLKNLRY